MAGWGGWGGWGGCGWGGWGGWGGSGGLGAAMAAPPGAIAEPLLAEALMRSRDGTVLQDVRASFAPKHTPVGDTASMKRWEAILRFNGALFDLLSGLSFTLGQQSATLSVQGQPLIKMERPNEAFFESQLRHVIDYAEIRADRASEIVVQMHPQVPFWSAAVHIHPAHTPKTLEMIELALGFASIICMRFKQAMAVARPIDWSTDIQPIIATPSHSAYPSGHATEAFMIAYALPKILTGNAGIQSAYQTQLECQAHRIAENRTVAGVHFPVDSGAGQILAKVLADYFLFSCFSDHAVEARNFEPSDKDADFDPVANLEACKPIATLHLTAAEPATNPLHWLAQKAREEFE